MNKEEKPQSKETTSVALLEEPKKRSNTHAKQNQQSCLKNKRREATLEGHKISSLA